jgi:hypothetical protein
MEITPDVHYALECPRAHLIAIPRPIQLETRSSLPETATDDERVAVACPQCGIVSVYSALDVRPIAAATRDPFAAGLCLFVCIEVECDDNNCEALTAVHTTIGSGTGTWTHTAMPTDWRFSPDCRCENRHPLVARWRDYPHKAWVQKRSPF